MADAFKLIKLATMDLSEEEVLKCLKELGWHIYCEPHCFQQGDINRYVDIDLPYIDVYTYADGEKYKGYLETEELILFSRLVFLLAQGGDEFNGLYKGNH